MTASGDPGDDAAHADASAGDAVARDGTAPGGTVAAGAAATAGLVESLEILRGRLAAARLPLDLPGAAAAREDLDLAVHQLDDYLLPRLRSHAAPLLVVVGGSTGAGKSTLVNSLLGEHVSAPGVLRPTTRAPVLVHHPLDERRFSTDRVLPGLARVSEHGPRPGGPRRLRDHRWPSCRQSAGTALVRPGVTRSGPRPARTCGSPGAPGRAKT